MRYLRDIRPMTWTLCTLAAYLLSLTMKKKESTYDAHC